MVTRAPFAGIRRVMVFIDGGYLQKNLNDMFHDQSLNYMKLGEHLSTAAFHVNLFVDLIRIYYYDAIPNESVRVDNRATDLHKIQNTDHYQLRLGRLKENKKGCSRQKGVDTLVAIDMISKAYEDHYDVAVLLAGDDDFLDVVIAVKNAGKRVYGQYFPTHISAGLKESFDKRFPLSKDMMSAIRN